MELFARESGSGSETVALIHGFGGSHAIWNDAAAQLSSTHRLLAYDLPGHGNSFPWPETGTPKVAVKALLADFERRGIKRIHLAGHSMGGAVSALLALAEPDRVSSLSLFAPGGFGTAINARALSRFSAAQSAADIRSCLEAMTGWDTPVEDDEVERELALRARPGHCAGLAALAGAITREGKQGEIPRDKLASLAMPVSVAWGTIDNVLPLAHTQSLPPAFALHILQGTGHMLPSEAPDFAAELIRRTAR